MKAKHIAAVCIFCMVSLSGQEAARGEQTEIPTETAEPIRALTVDDAVSLALANNVSIKRGEISLAQLRWARNFSWNGANPSINLQGSVSRPNEKTFVQDYDYSVQLGGSVSVTLTPALYSSVRAALLAYEGGELSYEQTVRTVEYSVRTAFYQLLLERENIRLQERNAETARRQYMQNKARYENGQLPEIDMLSSRLNYEGLQPDLQTAVLNFENDAASFKQLIGIPLAEPISISGSLSDAEHIAEFSLEYNIDETPAVRAAQNALAAQKNTLLNNRLNAYGPTITGAWSYNKNKVNTAEEFTTGGQLTVSVNIPLDGYMPWSAHGMQVLQAKYHVKDLEMNVSNQKTTTTVQINKYYTQIKNARAQIEKIKATIELAQRTYDATQSAYNQGTRDILSLSMSADSLFSSQVSFAQKQFDLIVAVLNLEKEIGIPFGTLGKINTEKSEE